MISRVGWRSGTPRPVVLVNPEVDPIVPLIEVRSVVVVDS
jgi:hypothetical protein